MENIRIEDISVDQDVQVRASLCTDTIKDYSEVIDELPPVTVFDDGQNLYLADGFHRYMAAKQAGRVTISAERVIGSKRDAILFSCGANSEHGIKRTNADKQRAVERLLADQEWSQWSNSEVAKAARVSAVFVGKIRSTLNVLGSDLNNNAKLRGADGKMRPAKIKKPEKVVQEEEYEDVEEEYEDVEEEYDDGPSWREGLQVLQAIRRKINEVIGMIGGVEDEPGFEELLKYKKRILLDINNAKECIIGCTPFEVCPYCLGVDAEICQACRGNAWVNKSVFESSPKENRDAIKRLSIGGDN
jgi:hypothetical protein